VVKLNKALRELVETVEAKPVLVAVLGKGGVGKTTVSIMLGYLLAELGFRTLVASLDPAKHLKEYLSLRGLLSLERITYTKNLYAIQYDVESYSKRVVDEYVTMLKRLMPALSVLNLDQIIDMVKESPGFEEEVFLRILAELHGMNDFDVIVVDTPPTGVALRVLSLPALYSIWVRQLKRLREDIVALRYVIARTLGRSIELRDPVLDKLEELRQKYEKLQELFKTGTTYVAVATPEPLPVFEVEVIAKKLSKIKGRLGLIIANRVGIASSMGQKVVEAKALEKLKNIACSAKAKLLRIKNADFAPTRLEDVVKLINLGYVDLEEDACT
jgi:arsenite-transporting ATPase